MVLDGERLARSVLSGWGLLDNALVPGHSKVLFPPFPTLRDQVHRKRQEWQAASESPTREAWRRFTGY